MLRTFVQGTLHRTQGIRERLFVSEGSSASSSSPPHSTQTTQVEG